MTPVRTLRPILLAALAGLLLAAPLAAAHGHICFKGSEQREAGHGGGCHHDDDLHFIVGWRNEPPFTGLKNGLDLGVMRPGHGGDAPIANLTTLQAQYEFGGKTFPLELRPQFGRAGWYTDDVTPTRAGQYTVRVWGTVEGKAVNFTFKPETVAPGSDIEFPEPTGGGAAEASLEARVGELEEEVAALKHQLQQLASRPGGGSGGSSNMDVVPDPPSTKGAPGLEPLLLLGALAAVGLALRRRA